MALSNMSFTNSVGMIEMSRITYALSHKHIWKGSGPATSVLSITINGWLNTADSALLNTVSAGDQTYVGDAGTLVLPNATYNNMRIRSISYDNGFWNRWGKASVVFDDDGSLDYAANYAITWDSLYTLYVPKIVVSPSTIKRSETTMQNMTGYFRQQLGYSLLHLNLTGVYLLENTDLPNAFLTSLEKKYSASGTYPVGYPYVFDLKDRVPEATSHLDIRQCVVTKSGVEWHVNERYMNVNIEIVAPPQTIT